MTGLEVIAALGPGGVYAVVTAVFVYGTPAVWVLDRLLRKFGR